MGNFRILKKVLLILGIIFLAIITIIFFVNWHVKASTKNQILISE